jgi:hypothetical protein
MNKQLPPDILKPHDFIWQLGSLIFNKNVNAVVNMNRYKQWWLWKISTYCKHPKGPSLAIGGIE